MEYEALLQVAENQGICTYEKLMPRGIKGLYADKVIWINKRMPLTEKTAILAEELGHYFTSDGNILDQTDLMNRKQELRARQWAYQCMLPLDRIVQAHHARISGRYDLAEYLGVPEEFLQAAIDRFTGKHGLSVRADGRHIVMFDPLGVIEVF
ncbi:ImmA/IrrE family metallo-endopeptidase [Paenibacillus paeoniae]|uniref:ImmA/IrrE family metallo-endopeptidase n=1 Tax=Paenibacillus paeoniae TaxID=2292705 RepID=A0A371P179_9BACL|nr:ImmA/IrrE family metallo-endopeptidase [Paenibacillus paeoniae]REK69310.1 ImmA/IrrE family metallo-endopeptidase [Paenibacillus paeoniae]